MIVRKSDGSKRMKNFFLPSLYVVTHSPISFIVKSASCYRTKRKMDQTTCSLVFLSKSGRDSLINTRLNLGEKTGCQHTKMIFTMTRIVRNRTNCNNCVVRFSKDILIRRSNWWVKRATKHAERESRRKERNACSLVACGKKHLTGA